MRGHSFVPFSVALFIATLALVGCGPESGTTAPIPVQPANGGAAALTQVISREARPDADASWMAPGAKSKNLLYVSDCCDVTVYSYPLGKLEGKIKGFNSAGGECVDKAGDVFIANVFPSYFEEYKHGEKKPIAELRVNGLAAGCAMDPTTGNLAATGLEGPSGGGVFVFPNASGSPTQYTDPDFTRYQFVGYDNKGNLFVDGEDYNAFFVFAELPKGGSALETITLNQGISYPGGVQWDGKYLAVGDFNNPVIYRFAISGSQGTSVGTIELGSGAKYVGQFFIQGRTLIAPDMCIPSCQKENVLFFKYPAGGTATKTITDDIGSPSGASVSLAPKE
jgi:hypothetical protein